MNPEKGKKKKTSIHHKRYRDTINLKFENPINNVDESCMYKEIELGRNLGRKTHLQCAGEDESF